MLLSPLIRRKASPYRAPAERVSGFLRRQLALPLVPVAALLLSSLTLSLVPPTQAALDKAAPHSLPLSSALASFQPASYLPTVANVGLGKWRLARKIKRPVQRHQDATEPSTSQQNVLKVGWDPGEYMETVPRDSAQARCLGRVQSVILSQ